MFATILATTWLVLCVLYSVFVNSICLYVVKADGALYVALGPLLDPGVLGALQSESVRVLLPRARLRNL